MNQAELIERLVDRVLYTVEQYTAGATAAVSTLSNEEYDAMVDACEQQVTTLVGQLVTLVHPQPQPEGASHASAP